MLSELYINNIAIIKNETIPFSSNLTVLTGETGAGKSIIIDAIELVLGSRTDKELIRHGESKACVSAVFNSVPNNVKEYLNGLSIQIEDDLVNVYREFSITGQSINKINNRTVPVSVLKDIGKMLISISGQHSNVTLLNPENHIEILDSFADTSELINDYSEYYEKMKNIQSEIIKNTRDEKEKIRRIEMLKFQISDINQINPKPGEEEELNRKINLYSNAEKTDKYSKFVYKALYRSDKGNSAFDLISRVEEAINALSDVVENAEQTNEELENIKYKLEDIAETVRDKCSIDVDNPSAMLDKAESRLQEINQLKKKYGSSVEEIIEFKNNAIKELKSIENSDAIIEDLNNELKEIKKIAKEKSDLITKRRTEYANILSKKMEEELNFLEMEGVQFVINVEKSNVFLNNGLDVVEFYVSANKGTPPMPISKIASGGEMSRIMLALKCAMADKEKTPVLIFDEIDTGISGKTSYKIGIKLKQSSESSQIICITHSPQIASIANEHILVYKKDYDNVTISNIKILSFDERVSEIARIIGGATITEKAVQAAKEMLINTQSERI